METELKLDEETKKLVYTAYALGFDAGAQATFKHIKKLINEIGKPDKEASENEEKTDKKD